MTRVLRWVIPADDEWHRIEAPLGSLKHVDTRAEAYAEVWSHGDDGESGTAWLRVFGTGQPTEGAYVGTAVTPGGALVWHVFAREA